ncbi:MAG: ATP-binding cassette domain-containing protein [Christensenellaceae bacterium]|jgi:ABC-type lipoprotein export system ATPase subunit/ABC-type antimicrobial peptide transport system permease subunit|nr:ATP-binding cassette domain-containing protein [Christensenellaceae bacterium]
MLTLKNIKKTYKSKKGTASAALKGINIQFPDNGLVFILGKSGSGKSTLLNIVGGLDSPDSGQIIIKGKSNKDFSGQDYDSYRNTYLGFIFQEYNVLDEFSVYDNVALSLRLQGKKAEKEAVGKILHQVGLNGFEKRKPNELSGGQKQRVAIARALVKEPEIIFADEPTGNLDSATSAQIFNLLGKLSKEKLVVIVSHDRDSAERYADRIIELADGIVISDITKHNASENEFEINSGVISIPKSRVLNGTEIEQLNQTIQKSKGKVTIQHSTANSFSNTGEVKTEKTDGFKLIKSRLPNRFAASIGASNFKTKKFRLIVTIFLTVVALALFGLSQIFSGYNIAYASAQSFEKNGITNIILKQGQHIEQYNTFNRNTVEVFNVQSYNKIREYLDDEDVINFYGNGISFGPYSITNVRDMLKRLIGKTLSSPITSESEGLVVMSEEQLKKYYLKPGKTEIEYLTIPAFPPLFSVPFTFGGYPTEQDSIDGKVLITDYLAWCLLVYQMDERPDMLYPLNDDYNYVHNLIMLYQNGFTDPNGFHINISGIIDTGFIDQTGFYKKWENIFKNSEDFSENPDYYDYVDAAVNYYSLMIAGDTEYINQYVVQNKATSSIKNVKIQAYSMSGSEPKYSQSTPGNLGIIKIGELLKYYSETDLYDNDYLTEDSLLRLSDTSIENPIILTAQRYDSIFATDISKLLKNGIYDIHNDFTPRQFTVGNFKPFSEKDPPLSETVYTVVGILNDEQIIEDMPTTPATLAYALQGIRRLVSSGALGWVPDEVVEPLIAEDYQIKGMYITLPSSVHTSEAMLKFANDHYIYHESGISNTVYMIAQVFDIFAIIFRYLALILGIFSTILLFNFVSLSVINKQKEIGILRAIGARGIDVSKIFLIEAFIIAAITVAFAWLLMFVGVWAVNALLIDNLQTFLQSNVITKISLLAVSVSPLVFVLVACGIITLIATLIPVIKISRMRPVDAIKKI